MLEISRWMAALGIVAATVGLTLVGIATTTLTPMHDLIPLSVWLMIGGLAVFVVGMVINRGMDRTDDAI